MNLSLFCLFPQPIDVSSFYRRELHETMQPRKLRSRWQLFGSLKAGAEESTGERREKNCGDRKSEESSSDEESSGTVGGMHTDDESERLDYGSEDSDLSDRLDEELERAEADVLEEKELSLPAQGWTECIDELSAVRPNHEEGDDQPNTPGEAVQQMVSFQDDMDFQEDMDFHEDMDLGEDLRGGEEERQRKMKYALSKRHLKQCS